jgi:CHAT domain-containing protein
LRTKLHSFLILLTIAVFVINCKPVSIQTTQYIQNGDRLANDNKFDEARVEYLQYLKLGAKLGIYRNELLEAETHRKLAYVYSTKAKYDSAIVQLNFALAKDLKFPDNQARIISDITELALVNAYTGSYRHSLKDIDAYLDSLKVSLRKNADRQAYSNLLLAKARIQFTLGEYPSCEKVLLECLKIIELYPFEVEKAEAKYLLGILYKDQGRLSESTIEVAAAISILKAAGLNCALPLHTQGDQLFLEGSLELGIAKHVEALKEAESSNIIPLIVRSHTYLGEAYEFIGDRKKADFHFFKAIELQRKLIELGYIESPLPKKGDATSIMFQYQQTGQKSGIAKASVAMADYYKTKGDLDSSLYFLNEAYVFYSQSLQKIQRRDIELKLIDVLLDKADLDSAKNMLAAFGEVSEVRTYELPYLQGKYANLVGKPEDAKKYLRQALTIVEETRSGFTIPSLRSNYLGNKNYVYEEMIEVLLKPANDTDTSISEAYDWNERARSRNFLDIIASKKISPLLPSHKSILEREQAIRIKLIKLNEEIEKNQLSEDLLSQYKQINAIHKILLDSIATVNTQYSLMLSTTVSTLKEIRKSLRQDELLIQYWIGADRSYAWYASRDTVGLIKLDFKEAELEREIKAFRNALKFKLQDETKEKSSKLFSRLLDPIPNLTSFYNLVIIPHRGQSFIPFEALQSSRADYLIQSHAISYAPSGTIFLTKRKSQLAQTTNMLAMALGEETLGSYTALPGTITEVQNVAKYFNPTQVKIGLASTESAIKSTTADFGLVHLATHGIMNKKNPLQSFIALNSDSLNDGRLTVSEIFDMKMSSSLTTLSACETALGEVNRGNELIGLSTAFLYSGSEAVIVSLWKVDDQATSLLMTAFYEGLSKGLTISHSMALAQRKLMAIPVYSSPYYWSPFIIIGDGQSATF